jgi:hypothetical protein
MFDLGDRNQVPDHSGRLKDVALITWLSYYMCTLVIDMPNQAEYNVEIHHAHRGQSMELLLRIYHLPMGEPKEGKMDS